MVDRNSVDLSECFVNLVDIVIKEFVGISSKPLQLKWSLIERCIRTWLRVVHAIKYCPNNIIMPIIKTWKYQKAFYTFNVNCKLNKCSGNQRRTADALNHIINNLFPVFIRRLQTNNICFHCVCGGVIAKLFEYFLSHETFHDCCNCMTQSVISFKYLYRLFSTFRVDRFIELYVLNLCC